MSSSMSQLDPVVIRLLRGTSVLDVGCGYGRWGCMIYANYWEAGLEKRPVVDAIDAFQNNVDYCSSLPYYRKVWKCILPDKLSGKWDTILACDIIEHIAQDKVERTLDMLEKAAKKRIIISTPSWPAFREAGEGEDVNTYESHLSYVSRKMLVKRGYKIIGVGFGNPDSLLVKLFSRKANAVGSKRSKGSSKNKLESYSGLRKLRLDLESLARFFPSQSICIVAYKDVDK